MPNELVEDRSQAHEGAQLRTLFHRLNNELGIVLSHAELLEAKTTDDAIRSRAAQIIASVLSAMGTTREIRSHLIEPDNK